MSKVRLASLSSLTFYDGEHTTGRRSDPIPQLNCEGEACRVFTPDVVRCVNSGGSGTRVHWTCEAELPNHIKLGRTDVSCEGWSKPGDTNVLDGSCSLTYRLVRMPSGLHEEFSDLYKKDRFLNGDNIMSAVFGLVWVGVLIFILLGLWKSATRQAPGVTPTARPGGHGGNPPGGGWFPGDDSDAPPPYDAQFPRKPTTSSQTAPAGGAGWRPGFWTGTALGGLGAYLMNDRAREAWRRPNERSTAEYDREQRDGGRTARRRQPPASVPRFNSDGGAIDRGEGSSSSSSGFGGLRTSTGYGGSSVR